MKIFIAADHRGFSLKEELVERLKGGGHEVEDLGPAQMQPEDDYPEYAFKVAEAVAQSTEARGIVICGSGAGVQVAANKVKGVRAALAHDPGMAEAARRDDNINVLALGSDFIDTATAQTVVQAFVETPFAGEEKHKRRLEQVASYENNL